MDIMDVPLHKVISGGNNNWALRQAAHVRTVQRENFRSRQEAIFCGVLMRGFRSEQAEQEAVLSVRRFARLGCSVQRNQAVSRGYGERISEEGSGSGQSDSADTTPDAGV